MPFTPTHIAAILPIAAIRRRELPFSALAIGAMLPDLPLFLPRISRYAVDLHDSSFASTWLRAAYDILFQVNYYQMHSIPGLLTICLPLGMACFLCFQPSSKNRCTGFYRNGSSNAWSTGTRPVLSRLCCFS